MSIQARPVLSGVAILLFGVWLGRVTAPAPPSAPAQSVLEGNGQEKAAPLATPSVASLADREEEPEDTSGSDAWATDPRLGMARRLAEWGGDPSEVLEVVIDSMSDRELRLALTSLTNFSEEQLDGVRDMREFTRRVAEVAVDNIYNSAASVSESAVEVQFSREVDERNAPVAPQERFSVDGRIYATFPMDEYGEDEVFVKWYRADDPEILLFDQYKIQSDADYSFVWLEQEGGWAEGEYVTEFYSTRDEQMKQIARGAFQIK